MGVIVIQAQAGQRALGPDPESARAALASIEDAGRQGLAEMRRLLGVLRAERGPDMAPQPGSAQLDALVEQLVRAGVPAALTVRGGERPLEGTVDVTLYRVAQEALTNVLKHAGEVTRVDVVLRYADDVVELVVRDDGRGARAHGDGGGHGLVGMRERVDLQAGMLEAGVREGGGFEVRAVIPAGRVGPAA